VNPGYRSSNAQPDTGRPEAQQGRDTRLLSIRGKHS
jgi:hypothetical protein